MSGDGEWEGEYSVEQNNSDVIFFVKKSGEGYLYNSHGIRIIDKSVEVVKDAGDSLLALGSTKYDDSGQMKFLYATRSGHILFNQLVSEPFPFSDGYAIYHSDRGYNYISKTGELISELFFKKCYMFSNGFGIVQTKSGYNYVSTKGELLSDSSYEYASNFMPDGWAYVRTPDGYNFIDTKGTLLSDTFFDRPPVISNDIAIVCADNKYGLFSKSNGLIVQCQFEYIEPDSNFFYATLDGKHGLFDMNGNIIVPVDYKYCNPYDNNRYILTEQDSLYSIYDIKGQFLFSDPESFLVKGFSDEKILIQTQHSIIERTIGTNSDSKRRFDNTITHSDTVGNHIIVNVLDSTKVSLYILDSQFNITASFDADGYCNHGKISIYQGSKYGVISEDGSIIIPSEYDYIKICDSYYLVENKGMVAIFDSDGTQISDFIYSFPINDIEYSDFDNDWMLSQYTSFNVLSKKGFKKGLILSGKEITPFEYERFLMVSPSIIAAYKNSSSKADLFSISGNRIGNETFTKVSSLCYEEDLLLLTDSILNGFELYADYVIVKNTNGYGVYDKNSNQIIRCNYDSIEGIKLE